MKRHNTEVKQKGGKKKSQRSRVHELGREKGRSQDHTLSAMRSQEEQRLIMISSGLYFLKIQPGSSKQNRGGGDQDWKQGGQT